MKTVKHIVFACLMTTLIVSCEMDDISCVRVDGPIEMQKRTLSGFNSIFFGDVGNLHVSQGTEYSFIIKGQRVILDEMEVSVIDNKLLIELDKCFNGDAYSLDIYVTAPEIKNIEMSGVGSITTETPLTTDNFSFTMSGLSEINSLNIQADSITTYHLGTGEIIYSGTTRTHTILTSGSGEINASDLASNITTVTSNSTEDVYLNVSEKLTATINNVGNIYYTGSPEINKNGSGTGKIIDWN